MSQVQEGLTKERWLKWAVARYYRSHGYRVTMNPARAGNAIVDGVAVGPEGERIAIESTVKSSSVQPMGKISTRLNS